MAESLEELLGGTLRHGVTPNPSTVICKRARQ